jgi:rhodanese-related sulfurtransferase
MAHDENGPSYAGDLMPKDAWEMLRQNRDARLVDVRSRMEWMLVGMPDTSALGCDPLLVEWQTVQGRNPHFLEQLESSLGDLAASRNTPILFLCRSGGRSQMAAIECSTQGFEACYNILHGFEGELDGHQHRNSTSGWRVDGLPWKQS